jgi:hypothetical protein
LLPSSVVHPTSNGVGAEGWSVKLTTHLTIYITLENVTKINT